MNFKKDMSQNYIDLRRSVSTTKAWLIERCITEIPNVAHICDWWMGGKEYTHNKNLAIRFTRWIDAKQFIDSGMLEMQYTNVKYQPMHHNTLIALSWKENPEGIIPSQEPVDKIA